MLTNELVRDIQLAAASLNGVMFAVTPHIAAGLCGIETEKGTLENISTGGFGALALNYAVTGYLATIGNVSMEAAIAYGHVPLILYVLKDFLAGEYEKAGVGTTALKIYEAIDLALVASILSGAPQSNVLAKILSIWLGVTGVVVYVDPVAAGKVMIEKDLSDDGKICEII